MTRICSVCRKSDILCPACSRLLEEGKVTKTDVDIYRTLARTGTDADFTRSIDTGKRLIIVAGSDAGRIIGKGGKTAQALEKEMNREVDVIEEGDEKYMISKMLRVPVVGINKVYGDGEKYKVRVERRFRNRVKKPFSDVEKLIGKRIAVVFE